MKKTLITFGSSLLLLLAAGCSSGSRLAQDTSVKAVLDYENNIIVLPLDAYQPSERDYINYHKVFDQEYGNCFARHGKPYPTTNRLRSGTRTYGLWNPEYHQLHGFGIEPEEELKDPETFELCGQEISADPLVDELLQFIEPSELIGRLLSDAYSAARDNPAWQEAKETWWACLKDQGLTPRTGSSEWGTEEDRNLSSLSAEENIRIATIQAQCSKDTGMAQTLADLEASYQAPLVKENQDALNSIKEDLETYRQKMQDYLAQHQ